MASGSVDWRVGRLGLSVAQLRNQASPKRRVRPDAYGSLSKAPNFDAIGPLSDALTVLALRASGCSLPAVLGPDSAARWAVALIVVNVPFASVLRHAGVVGSYFHHLR